MPLGYLNRCIWTAASAGTGDFVVSAAVTGYLTPSEAGAVNASLYNYWAWNTALTEWEFGTAAYTSAGTSLDRIPIKSSNADALVNFTAAPSVAMGGPLASTVQAGSADIRTGSATITIPTGATKCKVTLVGGGGGSGGSAASTGCCFVATISGAASTAAALIKYLSGLTPGNTLALTIGAAGAAGSAGNNAGGDGGDTILASGTETITTLTAGKGIKGGGAAANTIGTPAATAGAATNGDVNFAGSLVVKPVSASAVQIIINQNQGGQVPLGFGFLGYQSATYASPAVGVVGRGYGAPGNCAVAALTTARAGGAGTAGLAIFEWYA